MFGLDEKSLSIIAEILNIFGVVVALVGFFLVLRQMKQAADSINNARDANNLVDRTIKIETGKVLLELLGSPERIEIRNNAYQFIENASKEDIAQAAQYSGVGNEAKKHLDALEIIAILIKVEGLDESVFKAYWAANFRQDVERFDELILAVQNQKTSTGQLLYPKAYENAANLAQSL